MLQKALACVSKTSDERNSNQDRKRGSTRIPSLRSPCRSCSRAWPSPFGWPSPPWSPSSPPWSWWVLPLVVWLQTAWNASFARCVPGRKCDCCLFFARRFRINCYAPCHRRHLKFSQQQMDLKNDACCTRLPASVSSNYAPKGTMITIDGLKVLASPQMSSRSPVALMLLFLVGLCHWPCQCQNRRHLYCRHLWYSREHPAGSFSSVHHSLTCLEGCRYRS
jgi:hypothetical protein